MCESKYYKKKRSITCEGCPLSYKPIFSEHSMCGILSYMKYTLYQLELSLSHVSMMQEIPKYLTSRVGLNPTCGAFNPIKPRGSK